MRWMSSFPSLKFEKDSPTFPRKSSEPVSTHFPGLCMGVPSGGARVAGVLSVVPWPPNMDGLRGLLRM